MAAPKFAPAPTRGSTYYSSPAVVPDGWSPDRPGVVDGLQPSGPRLGDMGPDQGFALGLARRLSLELYLADVERVDDAIRGCTGIALRRASLFSRAPVVHDVDLAFTIWGFYDDRPPADLLALRCELFEGVADVNHLYAEGRYIADLVPVSTLRLTPHEAARAYPERWRELTGVPAE